MAKKSKRNEQKTSAFSSVAGDILSLQSETLRSVVGVVFILATIFFILSALNKAGRVGDQAYSWLSFTFGAGYYFLPLLFLALAAVALFQIHKRLSWSEAIGSLLLALSGLGLIELILPDRGGFVGGGIANPLIFLFEKSFSFVLLIGLFVLGLLVTLDLPLRLRLSFFKKKEEEGEKPIEPMIEPAPVPEPEEPEEVEPAPTPSSLFKRKKVDDKNELAIQPILSTGKLYVPPPIDLLSNDSGKPSTGDVKANANIIKRTLQNFGINVEMDEISVGPTVTRYALKPAEGVRLSRIEGLQKDLALALAAHPIRIEAPIPGKSLVGIEIPNTTKTMVGLGTLVASPEFKSSPNPLTIALGKGITGMANVANLGKAPHMMIAGATGAGKSVTLHAIITSLLFRNSPDQLKFLMVDPKRVELTLYNSIPHLLNPVITKPKEAVLALKWAIKEMERRYDVLESKHLQNIDSYHKNVLQPWLKDHKDDKDAYNNPDRPESMPYIVFIIDELADLMQTYGREVEAGIVRLAQMSRAVGIHLILSTQRPSVETITGLIKANIPSRIALQVASQIDSRTILDMGGAEKLLGQGDMLYLSGDMSKPTRIQSAFISEEEVKKVVKHLAEQNDGEVPDEIDLRATEKSESLFAGNLDDDSGADDDLYEDARVAVLEAGKASTSYLQRKLRVGYSRAARLMDMLEENGVIGAAEGTKPREVIDSGESTQDDTIEESEEDQYNNQ